MRRLTRSVLVLCAAGTTVVTATVVSSAAIAAASPAAPATAHHGTQFPTTISVPNGFQPEGLTIRGNFAYTGSLVTGTIAKLNLVNGQVRLLGTGPGKPSAGMKIDDRGRLFVAGGESGEARVVNSGSGAIIATYQVVAAGSFVNDVVLTPGAAYFTDSFIPTLYKLPLGRNGSLPAASQVVAIPLTGDMVSGPGFNANGISQTPDGRALIIVQTNSGKLFRVDPATGVTQTVDLGGATLPNGDGILLSGHTLFVVQNQNNLVATVLLDSDGRHGQVVSRVTDPRFDVPTAVAIFGDRLYLPNARFDVPPTPDTTYTVVAIPRPVL